MDSKSTKNYIRRICIMANEEKVVEVTEEVVEETVESTEITTKEAFKAIGHNAKMAGQKIWTKAKPKIKKAATVGGVIVGAVGGVIVGAAVLMDKINGQNAIEKQDDNWVDDDLDVVDGEAVVTETTAEEAGTVETEVADTNATE